MQAVDQSLCCFSAQHSGQAHDTVQIKEILGGI